MKKELEELLCQKYPLIFAKRQLPMTASGSGLACGDGWFDLIEALCERLQFWTDHNGAPQVEVFQVKEKWGALSFQTYTGASPEQKGMIQMAEAMSTRLCDECGQPGQTVVYGLRHSTRCAQHTPDEAISQAEFIKQRAALRP